MSDEERKVKFSRTFKCPKCNNLIEIITGEKIITPAVKAEKEEFFEAKLSDQKTLDNEDEDILKD